MKGYCLQIIEYVSLIHIQARDVKIVFITESSFNLILNYVIKHQYFDIPVI